MTKHLKRRILELCGLINLKREEKILKANEILRSTELKQAICNQIQGSTFKDIERTMESILKERQLSNSEQEMLELEKQAPEKFDLEFDFKINQDASDRKKDTRYTTYTREEITDLLAASKAPVITPVIEDCKDPYPKGPYPQDAITFQQKLIAEHLFYISGNKKKREE